MQLKYNKIIIYLTIFWLALTSLLGVWWLYFIVKLTSYIEQISPGIVEKARIIRMAKWEGATFLLLLFFVTFTLVYFYLRGIKKNRAISSFFASITHELKTPLANIKLQSEIIKETIEGLDLHHERLTSLSKRLVEDAHYLEIELEKLLQLSRIERGGKLSLRALNILEFFESFIQKNENQVTIDFHCPHDGSVMADEYALNLMLKNLINNTLKHTQSKNISIRVHLEKDFVTISYFDHGPNFQGDIKRIGELFYKGHESKGSGVGLYLIKTLAKKMEGDFFIEATPSLKFQIKLKRIKNESI